MNSRPSLPFAATQSAFDVVVHDETALRPGVAALCRSLGLNADSLQRFPTGSLPVYASGHAVLKLFPPVYAAEEPVESGVLAAVAGRLPVPSPALRAAGERDGWRYVLMSRLPGVDLSTVWPRLSEEQRRRLARQAGELALALHQVAPPSIEGWAASDWPSFVAGQHAAAVERHRRWGLPDQWLEQLPGFLAGVALELDPKVLLHTELMPANLMATEDSGGTWSLSGLCDFEPAMLGSREYDFVAMGIFLAEGNPCVWREALAGYGYPLNPLDHDLARRLLAWTLLHRYGNVASYLPRLPAPAAPTLDSLAAGWFGLK